MRFFMTSKLQAMGSRKEPSGLAKGAQGHPEGEGDAACQAPNGDRDPGLIRYSSILETCSIGTPVSAAKRRLR